MTNCHQLKMKAQDGKMRLTDVANTERKCINYEYERQRNNHRKTR